MLILIWNVTSTAATNLALAEAAFGCDSAFQPSGHPLRPRPAPRLPVFSTTGAAVMPAANARERLTQAPPYGRDGASIDRLRCTSLPPPTPPTPPLHSPIPFLSTPLATLSRFISPHLFPPSSCPYCTAPPSRRLAKRASDPLAIPCNPPDQPLARRFTFREEVHVPRASPGQEHRIR